MTTKPCSDTSRPAWGATRGSALIVTMAIGLILVGYCTALLNISHYEGIHAFSTYGRMQARYAAEGAALDTIHYFKQITQHIGIGRFDLAMHVLDSFDDNPGQLMVDDGRFGDEDLDGDGTLDNGEDLDDDGQLDAGEDVNGNGVLDMFAEDMNMNGVLDPGEDFNTNNQLDGIDEDRNGNGVLDPAVASYDVEITTVAARSFTDVGLDPLFTVTGSGVGFARDITIKATGYYPSKYEADGITPKARRMQHTIQITARFGINRAIFPIVAYGTYNHMYFGRRITDTYANTVSAGAYASGPDDSTTGDYRTPDFSSTAYRDEIWGNVGSMGNIYFDDMPVAITGYSRPKIVTGYTLWGAGDDNKDKLANDGGVYANRFVYDWESLAGTISAHGRWSTKQVKSQNPSKAWYDDDNGNGKYDTGEPRGYKNISYYRGRWGFPDPPLADLSNYESVFNNYLKGSLRMSKNDGTTTDYQYYLGSADPNDYTDKQKDAVWGNDQSAASPKEVYQSGGTWYPKPLLCWGSPAAPIELNGPVVVRGDLVISGMVSGVGAFIVGGNVYIPDDIYYWNPPGGYGNEKWFPDFSYDPYTQPNTDFHLMKDGTNRQIGTEWNFEYGLARDIDTGASMGYEPADSLAIYAAKNIVLGNIYEPNVQAFVDMWRMHTTDNNSAEDVGMDELTNTFSGVDGIADTWDDDVLEGDGVVSVEYYTTTEVNLYKTVADDVGVTRLLKADGSEVAAGDVIPNTGEDYNGNAVKDMSQTPLSDFLLSGWGNWGGNKGYYNNIDKYYGEENFIPPPAGSPGMNMYKADKACAFIELPYTAGTFKGAASFKSRWGHDQIVDNSLYTPYRALEWHPRFQFSNDQYVGLELRPVVSKDNFFQITDMQGSRITVATPIKQALVVAKGVDAYGCAGVPSGVAFKSIWVFGLTAPEKPAWWGNISDDDMINKKLKFSPDGTNYYDILSNIYDGATQDSYFSIPPEDFRGFGWSNAKNKPFWLAFVLEEDDIIGADDEYIQTTHPMLINDTKYDALRAAFKDPSINENKTYAYTWDGWTLDAGTYDPTLVSSTKETKDLIPGATDGYLRIDKASSWASPPELPTMAQMSPLPWANTAYMILATGQWTTDYAVDGSYIVLTDKNAEWQDDQLLSSTNGWYLQATANSSELFYIYDNTATRIWVDPSVKDHLTGTGIGESYATTKSDVRVRNIDALLYAHDAVVACLRRGKQRTANETIQHTADKWGDITIHGGLYCRNDYLMQLSRTVKIYQDLRFMRGIKISYRSGADQYVPITWDRVWILDFQVLPNG